MTSPENRSSASRAFVNPRAAHRLAACFVLGIAVAVVLVSAGWAAIAPLVGWDVAALAYLLWVWTEIGAADATLTAALAVIEDASRPVADLILLLAAVASLVGVGDLILLGAAQGDRIGPDLSIGLAIISVVLSWALVHTVFTVRYARLYYTGPAGGIDFNQQEAPRYTDFAYLSFTIGMTFQVSDTDLQTTQIRATALGQALLSYLFGVVIIATTINLIAGLAR